MLRDVKIAVVFHHAGKKHVRHPLTVKLIEILLLKRHGDLNDAIPAKIAHDHTVAILDRADRAAVILDDERIEILVGDLWVFLIISLDRLFGGCKTPALP